MESILQLKNDISPLTTTLAYHHHREDCFHCCRQKHLILRLTASSVVKVRHAFQLPPQSTERVCAVDEGLENEGIENLLPAFCSAPPEKNCKKVLQYFICTKNINLERNLAQQCLHCFTFVEKRKSQESSYFFRPVYLSREETQNYEQINRFFSIKLPLTEQIFSITTAKQVISKMPTLTHTKAVLYSIYPSTQEKKSNSDLLAC